MASTHVASALQKIKYVNKTTAATYPYGEKPSQCSRFAVETRQRHLLLLAAAAATAVAAYAMVTTTYIYTKRYANQPRGCPRRPWGPKDMSTLVYIEFPGGPEINLRQSYS